MASSDSPIVICLIGITGEGKSTTGNMLSQDPSAFKTSRGMRSMTSTCSFKDFQVDGVFYRVIDTPGLQDTNLSPEELHDRLRKFVDLSPNGVDAFLFVVKRGRFRPEYAQAFKAFEEACTTEVLKHTILLFTCLEDEGDDEFKQSLQSEEIPSLQHCLEKVKGRVAGVENKHGGKARQLEDRALVLSCVKAVKHQNLSPYNNQLLEEAGAWRIGIEAKAKELELAANQHTVLQLLQDLFYGRCERSDVTKKLAALLRSEAQFKAKDVVDAMAKMGQVREVCERLIFESNQLPDRCNKETQIKMGEFCSGHRECHSINYRGSNHPSNCSLYPMYTSPDQIAGSQRCQSDRPGALKKSLLDESNALKACTGKEFLLEQLQHLTPSATYEKLAADILARHNRIEASCTALAIYCPEKLTFHVLLSFQRTVTRTCSNCFRTEATRIQAANSRIAEFAKDLEKLAHDGKQKAATVVQAAFRGQIARRTVAMLRSAQAKMFQTDDIESSQSDASEDHATIQPANGGEGESQMPVQQVRKRRTRRGGMNKRLQEAAKCDIVSIPATDDGFD